MATIGDLRKVTETAALADGWMSQPMTGSLARQIYTAIGHGARISVAALSVLFLVCTSIVSVIARAAPPTNSGSILQQVQPQTPVVPPTGGTGLEIDQPASRAPLSSIGFDVKTIQISGNTIFDTETLHALVSDAEGTTVTLAQLDALAARITDHYHRSGYPLARAIIPAQTIAGGLVRMEVIEARYGAIRLENTSPVADAPLKSTLAPLEAGQIITQDTLDRSLLLLSDIPGVIVNGTLGPGATTGTSDLTVKTGAGPSYSGNADLDDYGNRYTGRLQSRANIAYNNPLGQGDVLSANVLSTGKDLDYARLGYQLLIAGSGTQVGAAYSDLNYRLGDGLTALEGHGTADVTGIFGYQPLIRSTVANLYLRVELDSQRLHDDDDASQLRNHRLINTVVISLSGDLGDSNIGGVVNSASWSATFGRLGFENAAAKAADEATAQTQGSFTKTNFSITRQQSLTDTTVLFMSFSGQWSQRNLDSSTQIILGGPNGVRGYDFGVASGASGITGTFEVRQNVSIPAEGTWQAIAFVDSGYVKVDPRQWVAGTNTAELTGLGLGLLWTGHENWAAKVEFAAPIGRDPALVGNRSQSRGWAQISKGF
jgi:hemolysin activation/secretion protein